MSVTSIEVIFTLCSPLAVSARLVTRITHSDDWLTCIALVAFIQHTMVMHKQECTADCNVGCATYPLAKA